MKDKKIVVFGLGVFSALMTEYIDRFTSWEIAAYCVDREYIPENPDTAKPVVVFEELAQLYPPTEYDAFIAIGYAQMGDIRERAFCQLKELGYFVRNFVHPSALCYADAMGEGNIVLENAVLGMKSTVGNCNLIWNSCNLSHECKIGSFNTLGVMTGFGGCSTVGDHCFFGINCTIKDHLSISDYTLVGAGAYLAHDTARAEAYTRRGGDPLHKKSSFEFTSLFGG